MKAIDISTYLVEARTEDGHSDQVPYDVRDSIIGILFNPNQRLKARELLDRDDLARKIRDWSGDLLQLENAEYVQLQRAVETLEGYGRHDVELVRRLLAPKDV